MRARPSITRLVGRLREQRRRRRERSVERAYRKDVAWRGRDERGRYGGPGHGVW